MSAGPGVKFAAGFVFDREAIAVARFSSPDVDCAIGRDG